jgi:hypothetical protein
MNKPKLADPNAIMAAPDPFDLASLRLNPSFLETASVKKLLTTVPARRPNPQDFVRVHPSDEYRADFALVDLKEDREDYLVRPEVIPELAGEGSSRRSSPPSTGKASSSSGRFDFQPRTIARPSGHDQHAREPSWR